MPKARPSAKPRDGAYDAGTLWRMARNGWIARCALWSFAHRWELRVTVDEELLFSRSSPTVPELFSVADHWKERMADSGWTKVTPTVPRPAAVA